MSDEIDPTRNAYGTTYSALAPLRGPAYEEYLGLSITVQASYDVNEGAFGAFTAGDVETLIAELVGSFQERFAPTAVADLITVTEQVPNTGTVSAITESLADRL